MVQQTCLSISEATVAAPLHLSNSSSHLPGLMFSAADIVLLTMTTYGCSCCLFIVGEVEVKIEAVPHRLPDSRPTSVCGLVKTPKPPLLTSCSLTEWPGLTASATRWARVPRIDVPLRSTVIAEPVTYWNFLETNTIGMKQSIAMIAIHQNIFIIIFLANVAWLRIIVVVDFFKEH